MDEELSKEPKRIQNKVRNLRKLWSTEITAGQTTNLIKLAKHRCKGKGWGMTRNLTGKYNKDEPRSN